MNKLEEKNNMREPNGYRKAKKEGKEIFKRFLKFSTILGGSVVVVGIASCAAIALVTATPIAVMTIPVILSFVGGATITTLGTVIGKGQQDEYIEKFISKSEREEDKRNIENDKVNKMLYGETKKEEAIRKHEAKEIQKQKPKSPKPLERSNDAYYKEEKKGLEEPLVKKSLEDHIGETVEKLEQEKKDYKKDIEGIMNDSTFHELTSAELANKNRNKLEQLKKLREEMEPNQEKSEQKNR